MKHIAVCLLLLLTANVFGQEITQEEKDRANELFEKEQYVEATPLYLKIIAYEPKNADWNFKYGACLLYNKGDKTEAIRYLKYGVNTPGTDERVFYFYGRALHLDYQFSAAKRQYEKYQSKQGKPDKRYPVAREIQMCDNGKQLLATFTDIIVTDKKQIDQQRFYDIYTESSVIGGSITVNRDFQSKLDKKKGHIPVVHIPPDAKFIFYSSWGNDESTGKDIYMRIRLPDKSWGKPQLVRGGVNSNEDEDYPFMHASGQFLYFSSKGHNSMGGYDIFMCRFDENTNSFGPPENIDFAISSPDDDLFYVVDASFKSAYFASSRSSEKDKIHVYNVKVVRVPIQEVIVMGNFVSEIKPEDQKIRLQIQKNTNGDDLITMPVSAEKGGRYSYVFPQGGKYDYVIDVDGGDQYKFTVELPYLDEFRPLKQEIIHTMEGGNEIIRIINKFDENVEGAEAIIAEVIRKKSELEVNVDQFDLEALENQQNLDELLVELGFDNMSLGEVADQLLELRTTAEDNETITERIEANVSSELLSKTERIVELDQMEKELRASAEKATDPVTRHKLLTEASQKQQEKEYLMGQVKGLETLIADVNGLGNNAVNPEKIKSVQEQFEALRKENEEEALTYLVSEKATIDQAKKGSPNQIKDNYTQEIVETRAEIKKLSTRRDEYRTTAESVRARINTLERQREGAKKKEQERIDTEITASKEELQLLESEIESISKQLVGLESELDATEERLVSYQNALSTEEKFEVNPTEVAEAKQEVEKISSETVYNYDAVLTTLEEDHPEINGGDPIVDYAATIDREYASEKEAINKDTSLSPLEQTSRLLEHNENTIQDVSESLTKVQEQLAVAENEHLRTQETALLEQKANLEAENAALAAEVQQLKEATPDAALSKEDVLAEITPDFEAVLEEIDSDPNKTELEKLTQKQEAYTALGQQLEAENATVSEALQENPNNETTKAKQALLRQLITENNQSLQETRASIADLPESKVVEITAEEAIATVNANYEDDKSEILVSEGSRLEKEQALLDLNEELLDDLEKEAGKISKDLERNPEDPELIAKQKAINQAVAFTESQIAESNQNIAALSTSFTPSVSAAEVLAEVVPNYEQDVADIKNGDLSPRAKEEALKTLEQEVLNDLEKERSKVQKRLEGDAEDVEAKARMEALETSITTHQQELVAVEERIATLNTSEEVRTVSPAEVLAEIAPNYEQDVAAIQNGIVSPKEKEEALKALEQEVLVDLEKERNKVQKRLDRDAEDTEAKVRMQALETAITTHKQELTAIEERIEALNSSEVPATVSSEEVLAEVSPNYEQERAAISSGEEDVKEKLSALKELEESTLSDLESARKKAQKDVDRDPENEALQARVEALDTAMIERQDEITNLDQQIIAANTEASQKSITSEDVLEEVAPAFAEEIAGIEAGEGTEFEKSRRKASAVAGVLELLEDRLEAVKKVVKKNPEDLDNKMLQKVLEETIAEQKVALDELQSTAIASLTSTEKEAILADVSPRYTFNSTLPVEEQRLQEQNVQSDLEKAITEKEKQLKRNYNVSVAIEKATFERLLEESKIREAELETISPTVATAAEFIADVRNEGGGEVTSALIEEAVNLNELKEQDQVLEAYERLLETKIEVQETLVNENPTQENEAVLNWLVEEKERVSNKRRSVRVSIGALEQVVIADSSSEKGTKIQELKQEESRLREAQTQEDLSNAERKQLKRELQQVSEERYGMENEAVAQTLNETKAVTTSLQENLEERGISENAIAQSTLEHAAVEEEAIAAMETEAKEAESEAERNYLLNEVAKRRDALNNDLKAAVVTSELAALEETFDIATQSRGDLEKQKRSYTIQIGEISREIQKVNQEITVAKRKELPELETLRADLITRKEQIQARLDRVNEQLSEVETTPTALNTNALKEEISFNEEREIAASEDYETYQKAAVEALTVANEIRTLEVALGERRKELQRAVETDASDAVVQEKAKAVQSLEQDLDQLEIELTQKKFTADQTLPQNEEQAMKMQNLVARGIQPLKLTAVATAIVQMPTTGFAIDTTSERPNNGAIEIPVGVENPEGLVYRVQVGAFARPLREDVFKEFNPVSGEKIAGTNITRYMAGYFSSSASVVDARQQIRSLGYSDAFVVAYCNGERITLGEARRREAAGICVPKRAEEIMIEVAENTAETLNIPISTEPEEVPEWSYAQAPGASDSDPIEKMEGLFFTVQIGVFNRAVSASELKNLPKISTFRLPNGQIRYNTGLFDSAEDALPRQKFARSSGIQGAFIVAYYNGKRISIGNARRLLIEYGSAILQSRMETGTVLTQESPVRRDSVRQDVIEITPLEEWEKRVQIVTEDTFEEFPRDVLNRYNAEGSFYFDEKDKRVKSTIYENEDYLPNLFNFKDDIDTIHLDEGLLADQRTEIIYFVFTDSLVPGAFMDWMLRCNYRREINRTAKGTEVRIFGVSEENMEPIIERIRLFGVEPDKIKEEE